MDLSFFKPDPMHSHLISIGETTAFPDREDFPRSEKISFDSYYIPSYVDGCRVMHRVTLTRAHAYGSEFGKVCFVDGNLLYKSDGGKYGMKINLFNSQEWKAGAKKHILPYLWFSLGDQKITIIPNAYWGGNSLLWRSIATKSPEHYGIFINNKSTLTGESVEQQEKRTKYCPSTIYLILLWPIFILWTVVLFILITPIQVFARRCEVRAYVVESADGVERGILKHRLVSENEMKTSTNEKTWLLG